MQPPVGTETRNKGGDEYVVDGFYIDSIFEPPNGSSELYGNIERLRIGDVLENPRYTPGVIGVLLLDFDQFRFRPADVAGGPSNFGQFRIRYKPGDGFQWI